MLITTRDAGQVRDATRIPLDLMTPSECRQTLRASLRGSPYDDATLDLISERLGRLPLALQVIGAVLARGSHSWLEVSAQLNAGHLPKIAGRDQRIFGALRVSVLALPEDHQARYRELVIFPTDVPLNASAVARLWLHTAGVEAYEAQDLLDEFRERSLIQSNDTLHDLQRDYLHATVPVNYVRALHSALCNAYAAPDSTVDASPWSMLPTDDDLYAWRFLATHLNLAERTSNLESLLTDVSYLEGKLAHLGVAATVSDLGLLSNVEPVRLIASIIRAGTVALTQDPGELMNQVRGRVGSISALHHLPTRALPYFDLYTQSLKPADPALERVFTGHTDGVRGCAFSPDGHYALSASRDQTLRLWEIATGREIRQFIGHNGEIEACAFSPDGRSALSASGDDTLRLWEVATGREIRQFIGHTRGVYSCAFSPRGRYALSASEDHTLRLWEVTSGRKIRQFVGHTSGVHGCAFSPDGRYALSASGDHTLCLWEVATERKVREFVGHASSVHGCAFSPDGRYALSASLDQTLRLWEIATGREIRQFIGHASGASSCAFSPDGRYALSASPDQTLRLWEVASGRKAREFIGHTLGVNGCAFSPDGRYALSASDDRTLRLWEAATGTQIAIWHSEGEIECCAFSSLGNRVLAGDSFGGVHFFSLVGIPVGTPPTPPAP
jgi:WD40 repeat protein